MYKNNPNKIPSKLLNEHLFTSGKNICKKCKKSSSFLYGDICPKCLKENNPSLKVGPFGDIL